MWDIKHLNKRGKEIVLQSGFATKEEAEIFLSQEYKMDETAFVVETIQNKDVNIDFKLSEQIGKWLWVYSPKKQEMFPYGIIQKCTAMFLKIQTKENVTDIEQMVDMRVSKIEEWIATDKGTIKEEGYFVTMKEYV
ncbi:hypothetical protein PP175_28405 (plasmid) [Aneurinibacillus sp. Ricciae_BoGa-3]|uniref:hypothetical protein n=1 Tax=Aneurinibacillus sp. Ricciae_BoGa-3 TaxID=3022697 RepID=UPI00233F7D57|nr:hypothetical protein [Aneurinibacillus sp. Ricciae_BoGa-3]WCK57114.1 hypothetical protein PP175_28405 [Aneurinibacillus sp. Ricciae_BoGa-3]